MASSRLNFDHITSACPSPTVLSKLISCSKEMWGSPTAPHQLGQGLLSTYTESLRALYKLLGAHDEDDIIITSSSAEAINHVISSVYYDVCRMTGKNHFVVGSTDEASSIMATSRLEPLGCITRMAHAKNNGVITAESVSESITPRTALVSLCWANGLTGVIHSVSEIAAMCKQRGILLHLDATHVLGKIFIELDDIGADFITFNGNQLHATQGVGALYIKKGVKLSPLILGGNEQGGLRGGGLNIPLVASFGVAAKEAEESFDFMCTEVARLRNEFESGITSGITSGFTEAQVLFKDQERVPHCTAILFPGIAAEALMYALDQRGVCASMGGGHFQQMGINLVACGIEESLSHCALSFSLGRYTTEDEVMRAVQIIVEEAKRLRTLSSQLILGGVS